MIDAENLPDDSREFPNVIVNDDVQKAAAELERLVREQLSLE